MFLKNWSTKNNLNKNDIHKQKSEGKVNFTMNRNLLVKCILAAKLKSNE